MSPLQVYGRYSCPLASPIQLQFEVYTIKGVYLCKTYKGYAHGRCLWDPHNCRRIGKRDWHKHPFNSGSICDYQQLPNYGVITLESENSSHQVKKIIHRTIITNSGAQENMVNCTGCIATTSSLLLFFTPDIVSRRC